MTRRAILAGNEQDSMSDRVGSSAAGGMSTVLPGSQRAPLRFNSPGSSEGRLRPSGSEERSA